MEILRFPPTKELSTIIRQFLVLRAEEITRNTLLPSNTTTLVFRISGSVFSDFQYRQETVPSIAISGARDFPRTVVYFPGTKVILVDFMPGQSQRFLGLPLSKVFGQTVPASEILNTGRLDRIEDILAKAKTDRERIIVIENFILSLTTKPETSKIVERAFFLIKSSDYMISVRQLVENLGTNKDSLEKSFRREFGVGPKVVTRIGRINRAAASLRTVNSLGSLALNLGFSDQSHFNHEFRTMIGLAPSEFIHEGEHW